MLICYKRGAGERRGGIQTRQNSIRISIRTRTGSRSSRSSTRKERKEEKE